MRTARRAVALVAISVLALAGCATASGSDTSASPTPNGIENLSAQQILDQARANAKAQTSVHLKGNGTCAPIGSFVADMHLRSDGQGTGKVSTLAGEFQVVTTPDQLYLKAPGSVWAKQASPTAVGLIGDKWVRFPKGTNTCLAALGSFSLVMANYVDLPGTPTKVKSDAVFGVPAQLVNLPPDVSYWVTTTGLPLPVYISATSVGLGMALSKWGAPVDVTTPSGSDVVDSTTLPTK